MGKKISRSTGFTVTETLIVVVIFVVIISFATYYTAIFNARQIGKEVAKQTKQYASLFGPYIYDMSESNLYQMRGTGDVCDLIDPFTATGSNTYVFSLANLQANNFGTKYNFDLNLNTIYCHPIQTNYWNDIYSQTNRYKQKPCLGVTRDTAGKYHGLLYWVNNANSQSLPLQMARNAAIDLGDAGAYVNKGKVVGANWSVPLSDPRLDGTSCGGTLAEGSIIYNLDLTTWVDELMPSGYIARESDDVHEAGTAAHTNTAQTSIIMNGNSIILDRNNNIGVKVTNDGVQMTGGTLQAEGISPQVAVDSGSACSAGELSTLKRQKDDALVSIGGVIANEICSYSPVICRLYVNSDYCYLPTKKTTINYHPNTQSFICPQTVPYMQSATAAYPDGSSASIQERGYQFGGYNIIRGADAIGSSGSKCSTWLIKYKRWQSIPGMWGCWWVNKGDSTSCVAGSSYSFSVNDGCNKPVFSGNCDGGSSGNPDGAIVSWDCTNWTPPVQAILTSVTCSNKYFIDQQ